MRINHQGIVNRNLRQRHIQYFRRLFSVGN